MFVNHHSIFSSNGLKYLDIYFFYIDLYMAFIIRIISVDYLYSHMSDLKIHQRQVPCFTTTKKIGGCVLELT